MLLLTACSAKYYREDADEEVYRILKEKHEQLYRSKELYEIETLAQDPLWGVPRTQSFPPEVPVDLITPDQGGRRQTPRMISLDKALEIATYNSRAYQTRKETIYLTALGLTEARNDFSAQFSGLFSGFWRKTADDESVNVQGDLGVSKLLKTGAAIGINLSTEFLRFLTGDPRRTVSSILAVSIIQPLWRGAGERIAAEDLRQAERDVLYEIRAFARFKKTFTVEIASDYYRVLQQRAVTRNEQLNFQNLFVARDRAQMLAQAGRLPEFQVDQAKQDELRAKDRWITAARGYLELLDGFKIDLGLATDEHVVLDEADLEALLQSGIIHPDLPLEAAVSQALAQRQDLQTVADQVADAQRRIVVAQNNLGPDVDLVFDVSIPTEPETKFTDFQLDQATWRAGVEADLPLERLSERNAYRAALIGFQRNLRDLSLRVDGVKQEVRNAWRTLQQTQESYAIQKNSLELAQRRVDSTTLLLQAGRADTRDLLESQEALVEAQNALIRALTDHTIARLEFYRDTGALKITAGGRWDIGQRTQQSW